MRHASVPRSSGEFFSSITNIIPRGPEQPYTPQETTAILRLYYESEDLVMLYPGANILSRLLTLLETVPVTGRHIHDLHLAATMQENGVTKICTYDAGHFDRIPGIETINPDALYEKIKKAIDTDPSN